MPDCYAESADGVILVANGIDPVVRWDGYAAQAEEAGVIPPDQATVPVVDVVGAGAGTMNGTYRVYVRFVDRAGNVSNLSPVSNDLTLTFATGLRYSNLPVPTQPSVARRQVLRNTDGQASVYYVDVDTEDLGSPVLLSSNTDAQLSTSEAVPLLTEGGLPDANAHDVPPSTKPFLAFHLGMMWAAGAVAYAEGSCRVARFSAAVTGVGTEWRANWVGRFLYVKGASRAYEIDSVDPVAQTITLVEPYQDATDPFAVYAIKPSPGDAATLYFSRPGQPESWPAVNGLTIPEDGDHVAGLASFRSFLWILKRRKIYRVTAQSDPLSDAAIFYALGRGCVNNRCWVVAEDTLYLMDEGGVYRTGGGDEAEQVSTPIQDLFRRDGGGLIDWSCSRFFHCLYSPKEEVIRWFITIRGDYLPRHALTFNPKGNKWTLDEFPVPISASVLGRIGGRTGGWADDAERPFFGGPAGSVYTSGGWLDGLPEGTPGTRGTATSAGSDTLTDATAGFPTGLINVPVAIVAGRGKGQLARVVSSTLTTLRVAQPWRVKPDATSVYQLGAVRFAYTGGRVRFTPGEDRQGRSVELQFEPTALPQTADLKFTLDFVAAPRGLGRATGPGQREGVAGAAGDAAYTLDLTTPSGHLWQRCDGGREPSTNGPRTMRVGISGFAGPEGVRLGEMLINGAVN